MELKIGENLRRLRLGKGLTQEQAAEAFGVSAQAVSRWENDSAYPDITLLPGIAMFYGVSIDEFVGMDEIRRREKLHETLSEIYTLAGAGRMEAATAKIRSALRFFPNDSGLLMALGETLAHRSDDEAVDEAISAAERVLRSGDVSMKARCTTTANLIFLYLRRGEVASASELLRSLPHIWESREVLAPEVCEGEEYEHELRKVIVKALVFFCGKIDAIPTRERGATPEYIQLGVDFEPTMSVEAMLARLGEFLRW